VPLTINFASLPLRRFFRQVLKLRSEDIPKAGWMFAHNFWMGFCLIILLTVSTSLFLGQFRGTWWGLTGVAVLPIVQVLSAFIYLLFSSLRLKLFAQVSLKRYLTAAILGIFSITTLFCCLLQGSPDNSVNVSPWLMSRYPLLLIWMEVVFFAFPLHTELISNHIFDPRQARRVTPIAMAGQYSGFVLGAAIIAIASPHLPLEQLLWLAPIAVLSNGVCYRQIVQLDPQAFIRHTVAVRTRHTPSLRGNSQHNHHSHTSSDRPAASVPLDRLLNLPHFPQPLKSRFFGLLCGLTVCSVLLYYWIDFQFQAYTGLHLQAPDIPIFLGRFYVVLGLAQVGLQSLLSNRVVMRFGLFVALGVLPVFTLSVAIVSLTVPSLSIFLLLTVLKGGDYLLRGLIDTSRLVLFQAIPEDQRDFAQSITSGILWPCTTILSGVGLGIYNALLPTSTTSLQQLAWLILGAGVTMLGVVVSLKGDYLKQLLALSTRSRQLFRLTRPWTRSTYEFLETCLTSKNVNDVTWALHQYQPGDQLQDLERVRRLLVHPQLSVRCATLQMIDRLQLTQLTLRLYQVLEQVSEVEEARLITQVLVRLDPIDAPDKLTQYLETYSAQPNIYPRIQLAPTIARVLATIPHLGLSQLMVLQSKREQWWDAPDAAQRSTAILLQSALSSEPYAALIGHLKTAIAAPANPSDLLPTHPPSRPPAVNSDRNPASTAPLSLQTYTPQTKPIHRFLDDPDLTVQAAALTAVAQLQLKQHYQQLLNALTHPQLHATVLEACLLLGDELLSTIYQRWKTIHRQRQFLHLVRLLKRMDSPAAIRTLFELAIESPARLRRQILVYVIFSRSVEALPTVLPTDLQIRLIAVQTNTLEQLQDLLAIVPFLPAGERQRLRRACLSEIDNLQATLILSLLESYPKATIQSLYLQWNNGSKGKTLVIEILDNLLNSHDRDRLLPALDVQISPVPCSAPPPPPLLAKLPDIVQHASPWLTDILAHEVKHHPEFFLPELLLALSTSDAWLSVSSFNPMLPTAEQSWNQVTEASISILNRVILLGQTSLFSSIADEVLGEIALCCREEVYPSGHDVFVEGDVGQSLYIIASGCVTVTIGGKVLREMSRGECFGEMSILDAEARSATVRTIEQTVLLVLDAAEFLALLQDEPDIANGVIRILMSRVRDLSQRVN